MSSASILVAVLINASYAPILFFALQKTDFFEFAFFIQFAAFIVATLTSLIWFGRSAIVHIVKHISLKAWLILLSASLFFVVFNLSLMFSVKSTNPIDVNLIGEAWPVSLFVALLLIRRNFSEVNLNSIIGMVIGCVGAATIVLGTFDGFQTRLQDPGLGLAIAAAVFGGLNNAFFTWATEEVQKSLSAQDMAMAESQDKKPLMKRVRAAAEIPITLEAINRMMVSLVLGVVFWRQGGDLSNALAVQGSIVYAAAFVVVAQNVLWTIGLILNRNPDRSVFAFLSPLLSVLALVIFADIHLTAISAFGGLIVVFASTIIQLNKYVTLRSALALPALFLSALYCLYDPYVIASPDHWASGSSISIIYSVVTGFILSAMYSSARGRQEALMQVFLASNDKSVLNDVLTIHSEKSFRNLIKNADATVREKVIAYSSFVNSDRRHSQVFSIIAMSVTYIFWELIFREPNILNDIRAIMVTTVIALLLASIVDLQSTRKEAIQTWNYVKGHEPMQRMRRGSVVQVFLALSALATAVMLFLEKYQIQV
jgi:drug/metabolite transporter (DMT)-like permease